MDTSGNISGKKLKQNYHYHSFMDRVQLLGRQKGDEFSFRLFLESNSARKTLAPLAKFTWMIEETDERMIHEIFRNTYSDLRVVLEDSVIYFLLKGTNGIQKIEVTPKFSPRNQKMTYRQVERSIKQVNQRLDNYEKKFPPVQQQTIRSYYSHFKPRKKWKMVKPFMDSAERRMSYKEFDNYTESSRFSFLNNNFYNQNDGELRYVFAINNLSVYNCDQIGRLTTPASLVTRPLKDENLKNSYVYFPEKDFVLNYQGGMVVTEKNEECILFNITDDSLSTTFIRSVPSFTGLNTGAINVTTEVKFGQDDLNLENIENILKELQCTIFPNPTKGPFTLKLENVKPETEKVVKVYNYSGALVFTEKMNSNELSADFSAYSQGFYLIQVFEGNQLILSDKLVINR